MRRKMKKMRTRSQVMVKLPSLLRVVSSLLHSVHTVQTPIPCYQNLHISCSCLTSSPPLRPFPSIPFFISTVSMCITVIILVVCVSAYAGCFCLPLLAAGDYCPWDRELRSGLWLEKYLTDEDDVGTFKGSGRSACWCVCSNFERDSQSWLPREKNQEFGFLLFFYLFILHFFGLLVFVH